MRLKGRIFSFEVNGMENVQIETQQSAEQTTFKTRIKRRFTTKRIAVMAVFLALSYAVSLWEIPLPLFGASFLKLDFGNVFIVLLSFLLGPIDGIIV